MDALFSDSVAFWSLMAIIGSIVVLVFLGIRLVKLINTTHSED